MIDQLSMEYFYCCKWSVHRRLLEFDVMADAQLMQSVRPNVHMHIYETAIFHYAVIYVFALSGFSHCLHVLREPAHHACNKLSTALLP
jgi:hypothetical protein